jgi:hypothetical protein
VSRVRCAAVPRANTVISSFLNRKAVRRSTLGVALAILILLPMATYASAQLVPRRRFTMPSASVRIWFTDFESGDQGAFTGGGEYGGLPQYKCGNAPGQVVSTLEHAGTYSAYYYVNPNAPDPCQDFPTKDFVQYNSNPNGAPTLTTHDFYSEVWAYIPSQTIIGWICLSTVEFANWATGIMVDTNADRKVFIWTSLPSPDSGEYDQVGVGVQWQFDKWFKIGLEVHPDRVLVYQDNQLILQFAIHQTAQAMIPWMFHWGLYVGQGQKAFAIYNDDIAIYDFT